MILMRMTVKFPAILKMHQIGKRKLSDLTKFRLDEIKKIETYFHEETNQRRLCNKKVNKYVTIFNYLDKILIILRETTGGICFISNASVFGAPVGIASAGFTVFFFFSNRNSKKKKKKFLICLCILFISSKMLNYFSSGLILIKIQLSFLPVSFSVS